MHKGLDTSRCLCSKAVLKPQDGHSHQSILAKAHEAREDICKSEVSLRVGAGRSPVALPLVWL